MAKQDKKRQLSIQQENAIDLLVQGYNDRETAEAVNVARQTVTEWRNSNAIFIAELNDRRKQVWGTQADRLRQLVAQAVDALADGLESTDSKIRTEAAIHVLKCVGLYGANLRPTGPTEPEEVELKWKEDQGMRYTREMLVM